MPKTLPQTKKKTFSLDRELANKLKQLASQGAIVSQSDFVERAIAKELEKRERQRLEEEFKRAGKDPLLLADIAEVERDFAKADREVIPEE